MSVQPDLLPSVIANIYVMGWAWTLLTVHSCSEIRILTLAGLLPVPRSIGVLLWSPDLCLHIIVDKGWLFWDCEKALSSKRCPRCHKKVQSRDVQLGPVAISSLMTYCLLWTFPCSHSLLLFLWFCPVGAHPVVSIHQYRCKYISSSQGVCWVLWTLFYQLLSSGQLSWLWQWSCF